MAQSQYVPSDNQQGHAVAFVHEQRTTARLDETFKMRAALSPSLGSASSFRKTYSSHLSRCGRAARVSQATGEHSLTNAIGTVTSF